MSYRSDAYSAAEGQARLSATRQQNVRRDNASEHAIVDVRVTVRSDNCRTPACCFFPVRLLGCKASGVVLRRRIVDSAGAVRGSVGDKCVAPALRLPRACLEAKTAVTSYRNSVRPGYSQPVCDQRHSPAALISRNSQLLVLATDG